MTDPKPPKAPKAAATPPPPAPAAPAVPPVPQPYAQPQQQPYGGGAVYQGAPVAPTNTLAIVALVLAFVVPLGAIICGHIALGQIKRTGENGHGLALAGTVLGYVFTGLGILFAIIYIIVIVAVVGSGALTPGTVI